MAKQAERRAATTEAILNSGRRLFGERGFAATTIDDIAEAAGVAKGAVYHHFATKEALFEAVFDQVSRDLVSEIGRAVRTEKDVLAAMVAGTQHYFSACAKVRPARSSCATARPCSAGSGGAKSTRSILAARFRGRLRQRWTPACWRGNRSNRSRVCCWGP